MVASILLGATRAAAAGDNMDAVAVERTAALRAQARSDMAGSNFGAALSRRAWTRVRAHGLAIPPTALHHAMYDSRILANALHSDLCAAAGARSGDGEEEIRQGC